MGLDWFRFLAYCVERDYIQETISRKLGVIQYSHRMDDGIELSIGSPLINNTLQRNNRLTVEGIPHFSRPCFHHSHE